MLKKLMASDEWGRAALLLFFLKKRIQTGKGWLPIDDASLDKVDFSIDDVPDQHLPHFLWLVAPLIPNLAMTVKGPETAKGIGRALEGGCLESVTALALRGNIYFTEGAVFRGGALFPCPFPSLRTLTLDGMLLDEEGQAFTRILRQGRLPSLTALYLRNNELGKTRYEWVGGARRPVDTTGELKILTSAIGSACLSLQKLHLGNNPLTDKGARIVADDLSGLPNLKTLILEGVEIQHEGLKTIANCMARGGFSSLETLSIELKGIRGDYGLTGDYLSVHERLKSIAFFSPEKVNLFLDVLAKGGLKSLRSLQLSCHSIGLKNPSDGEPPRGVRRAKHWPGPFKGVICLLLRASTSSGVKSETKGFWLCWRPFAAVASRPFRTLTFVETRSECTRLGPSFWTRLMILWTRSRRRRSCL
uniref:Uncharacterized protein n=1 Tax=Chromera velia CCMP2878 TaxID=1169474 RepID=A0A0G4HED7_9ALVE|eukprot:Cvel_26742.t1-p1 / transcript=Cvel_26742.t1 / gene=Cvel_26742 / organism=Chromera_velia_CCMP2878 / gene_product=hypothetical protein / transcript_product=hypothetical protein / location=Cvel_scaffold3228:16936-18186(-) / protein_length=417 / sequence_SO=supercontig / SO=protein_coding / is_pseudo=false